MDFRRISANHRNRRSADGAREHLIVAGFVFINGNAESKVERNYSGARLACRPDGIVVVFVPEELQFWKNIHGLLVRCQEHNVRSMVGAAHYGMRIVRFEIENLKEADLTERPCGHRASGSNQSTQHPVLQLLLHVNLHLTTTAFSTCGLIGHAFDRPSTICSYSLCSGRARADYSRLDLWKAHKLRYRQTHHGGGCGLLEFDSQLRGHRGE